VQSLRNVPSLAWVPLFILWLGIYELSKVTLIAAGVFFPVYLNLMSGIQSVDRKLVEVGRVYRLSGLKLVRRVLLPATLPAYFVGLRSGLGLGWMFVIAAELMGASKGLGFLLLDGQMTSRPQVIIGSLVLFAILGKLTDVVLVAVGDRFVGWQDTFKSPAREADDAAD
jgi:sulfonate transport system permease protein